MFPVLEFSMVGLLCSLEELSPESSVRELSHHL